MCEKTVHQQAIVRTFNDELGVCIKCDRDDERVPHTPEGESSG